MDVLDEQSKYLTRPRINEILNCGVNGKITFLYAGSGWGKTTAVMLWAQKQDVSVYWCYAEENEPYIDMEDLRRLTSNADKRLVLVIDNFHLLRGTGAFAAIIEFIKRSHSLWSFILLSQSAVPDELKPYSDIYQLELKLYYKDIYGSSYVATGNSINQATVSLTSGSGTLLGTKTVTLQNGVAQFSDLGVTGPGTYTMTATCGGLSSVSSSFTVTDTSTYGISLDKSGTQTFAGQNTGYSGVTPLTVAVSNTGNQATGDLSVALSGTSAGAFTVSKSGISSIAASGSDSFTVEPKTGLSAGTYTATVTVSGINVTTRSFDVSFTVTDTSTYGISLDKSGTQTFAGQNTGYSAVTPLTVAVSNTGNQATGDLSVALSGTSAGAFTVSKSGISSIAASGSDTFTVAPNDALTSGTYTATVTVSGSNVISQSFTVSFIVNNSSTGDGGADGSSGTGGGSSSNTVTVPVFSNAGSTNIPASISGSTATIAATDTQLQKIVSSTETGAVKIDVSGLNVDAVVVSSKIVSTANSASGAVGMEVGLPTGTVTLDKPALASVVDKGDMKFSVETVSNSGLTDSQKAVLGSQASSATVVDVNVYAGGSKVSTFGDGKITVSVPYTLKSGESADNITVWFINDDGTIEPKSGTYADGKVTFTTEHLSQYLIVDFPFADVAESAWCYGSVAYAYNNGLFAGTSETTFSPDTAMTRQMIWMVLARMDGQTPANMAEAKAWAVENGISDGANPTGTITRQQMAAILYRYAQCKGYDVSAGKDSNILSYDDALTVSEYAIPALQWACGSSLIQGSGNNLMPFGNATRAQVATILQRFSQSVVK